MKLAASNVEFLCGKGGAVVVPFVVPGVVVRLVVLGVRVTTVTPEVVFEELVGEAGVETAVVCAGAGVDLVGVGTGVDIVGTAHIVSFNAVQFADTFATHPSETPMQICQWQDVLAFVTLTLQVLQS